MENNLSHSLDSILRPENWDEYIGQEDAKESLKLLIKAATNRGQIPEHVLINGPAGLGKTTLAYIIGKELNLPIQTTSGVMLERSGDIVSIASTLENGGILFIDEIHRLNKNLEETLYPIMEKGSIDIVVGKGPTARSINIDMPPIMIVAATTQIGKISSPLRSRFSGGTLQLTNYSEEELSEIIKRSSKLLNFELDDSSAMEISKRSRSTPRTANYLLKRVRDYSEIKNIKPSKELVKEALEHKQIDEHGLTREDRNLLNVIYETFNGGPVGVQAIASVLSEDPSTIEDVYEPFLIQIGFLERTPRGRSITEKGINYLFNK